MYNPRVLEKKNDRAHILHIVRRAEGGIRRHVITLLGCLDSSRFEQYLAAPADFVGSLPSELAGKFAVKPVEITDRVHPLSSIRKVMSLAGEIRGRRIDLVHCHGYRAAAVGVTAAVLARRPAIITAHNLFPENASAPAKATLRFVAGAAKAVIAVSPSAERTLISAGVAAKKVRVIPNGVEIPAVIECLDSVPGVELPPEARPIICIARLTEIKGVKYLIDAAAIIEAQVPGARIIIAGDGPDREALETHVYNVAPGLVQFLGYREDVGELLKFAEVVVMPSLAEGAPLVLAEAMALGRPFVGTAVGGISDAITDGKNGLLVPPKDPMALANAVVSVLQNPELARILGRNARRYAEAELDVRVMVERTTEVYKAILGPA